MPLNWQERVLVHCERATCGCSANHVISYRKSARKLRPLRPFSFTSGKKEEKSVFFCYTGGVSKKSLHGFTLVELSIVLLIIGMITTGIIGGRELLRQSELQSVISDVEKYKTAIHTFEMAYNALPGDFKEGAEYWPGMTTGGNGDNYIEWYTDEHFDAFEHLYLANTIPDCGDYLCNSKIDGGKFSLQSSLSGYLPGGTTGTFIVFGKEGVASGYRDAFYSILSPAAARTIDLKVDDGLAGDGMIYTSDGGDKSGCAGVYSSTSLTYNLSNKDVSCRMWFWIRRGG
jgi:prepilin-type N-terminal cleavage/methylation domain-containing protein